MLNNNFSLFILLLSLIAIAVGCIFHWESKDKHQEQERRLSDDDVNKEQPQPPRSKYRTLGQPYALSNIYLTNLAKTEQEIYIEIKNYVGSLKDRLQIAEAYLKDYEESTERGNENLDDWQKAREVSSNPLMSYKMIRRFAKEFNALEVHFKLNLETQLFNQMKKLGRDSFPTGESQIDALQAILRLQYIYDLLPSDLARGKVQVIQTNVRLTTSQCFEIAQYAVKLGYYTLAKEWLETTMYKNEEDYNNSTLNTSRIDDLYDTLIKKHDQDFEDEKYNLFMFDEKLSINPDAIPEKEINMEELVGDPNDNEGDAPVYNFFALCNGQDLMSDYEKSKLYCWYERKNNPYFTIFPLKMELLKKEPYVVQIYDIVNDAWINDMKRKAIPKLERAPRPVSAGDTPRTAVYAWLTDEEIPETPIGRRVELLFDLNVRGINASEKLQIAAYAFGAHVSTHYDSLGAADPENAMNNPTIKWKGDRVSTFLVYLNDVNYGGLTAFPLLGIAVKPIKGSAVYWYTSLKNGKIDSKSLHGACPIVYGEKWIATKWTHSNENFLKRPCALDPNV